MLQDLRFAFRMLAAHRWFSAAVIVTLALGIGINTTVFTLVNAVLFKPVPIPGGERIVTLAHQNLTKPGRESQSRVSWPDYLEYKARNRSFEGLEAVSRDQGIISEPGNPPERFSMARVSPGLFTLLRLPPDHGARVHPRRRAARRRSRRPSRPRGLAEPLRRCPRCRRPRGAHQWQACHHHRRDARRLQISQQ